ncbi:MAG: hypothetical protein ACJ740_02640 [Gaiellales bacterium]|jgi:hypothetical protein
MASKMQCRLCGRQETWGLLSSQRWGQEGGKYCACPTCMAEHPDWRDKLAESAAGD